MGLWACVLGWCITALITGEHGLITSWWSILQHAKRVPVKSFFPGSITDLQLHGAFHVVLQSWTSGFLLNLVISLPIERKIKKLVLSPTILVTHFCNPAQRIPWKSTETVSNLAGSTVAQQWKGIVTLCCSAVCFVRSNQSGPQLSLPPKGGSSWVGGHTQRWGSKHSKMQLYWEVSVDFVRRKDLSITDPKLYQFSGKCLKTRNPKFATCAKKIKQVSTSEGIYTGLEASKPASPSVPFFDTKKASLCHLSA